MVWFILNTPLGWCGRQIRDIFRSDFSSFWLVEPKYRKEGGFYLISYIPLLKKSEICLIWDKSDLLWGQNWHPWSPSPTKQPKKGHNSVILKDKNTKKLHNMHIVITNLNPKLWIRTYNGFAVIPDLRQTGISENLATFGQK